MLAVDPELKDDFSTEEDVRGREEVEKIAEEKRKMLVSRFSSQVQYSFSLE